jgi:FAD/FMN-containing dehydrogenase
MDTPEDLRTWKPPDRDDHAWSLMGDTDLLASSTRAAESLAPGVWQRLQAIRKRYDPDGAF